MSNQSRRVASENNSFIIGSGESMIRHLRLVTLFIAIQVLFSASAFAQPGLLEIMQAELDRNYAGLEKASAVPLYDLQYTVTEERNCDISATNGGMEAPRSSFHRYLDVDVRVGSMELDNTHEIRGGNFWDNYSPRRVVDFPVAENAPSMQAIIWAETEYQYQKAQERFTKVLTNRQVKVEEEDLSNDFSPANAEQYEEPLNPSPMDTAHWQQMVKRTAEYFTGFPFVYESRVQFAGSDVLHYAVSSEQSQLLYGNHYLRLIMNVSGMAADGMELERTEVFSASKMEHMPDEATVQQTAARLVQELEALIHAPIVEPYIGPAILSSRASGVFFHEIFGHRIEGHRQKSEQEGQTFTKKLGEQILPDFISIYDDPTLAAFQGIDLRGHYQFDDEGVPAQRVAVVEKGILKNFLTSRSPINNFPASNSHGRRQYGYEVVSRQGNLLIESSKAVSYQRLREMLIEECRRQNKDYGLVFQDISGGFTSTDRGGPQAFKVLPLLVYRVFADGRPDEVVRGVDIVGTPLTCFSKILMAADDAGVFNGTCGAESGLVPVSAISPSLLVSEIEVEKRQKEQEKPPILPPPEHDPMN